MRLDYLTVLTGILAERGLDLPAENLESAASTHEKLKHEFEKLRSVELEYLPPYLEPMTALHWIESFGDEDERP